MARAHSTKLSLSPSAPECCRQSLRQYRTRRPTTAKCYKQACPPSCQRSKSYLISNSINPKQWQPEHTSLWGNIRSSCLFSLSFLFSFFGDELFQPLEQGRAFLLLLFLGTGALIPTDTARALATGCAWPSLLVAFWSCIRLANSTQKWAKRWPRGRGRRQWRLLA